MTRRKINSVGRQVSRFAGIEFFKTKIMEPVRASLSMNIQPSEKKPATRDRHAILKIVHPVDFNDIPLATYSKST